MATGTGAVKTAFGEASLSLKPQRSFSYTRKARHGSIAAQWQSLFDPCPAGCMVPPADMWLSFTVDGKNSGWGTNATSRVNGTFQAGIYGHKIYVEAWKSGKTVYFPSNGFRNSNGTLRRNGNCGNYHTSTPSTNGTVNCFHIHNASAALPFETGYESTRRAFAGPVRCVRDVDD